MRILCLVTIVGLEVNRVWQEYGKSMARVSQEYGKSMARVWQEYDKSIARVKIHVRRMSKIVNC